MSVGRGTRKKDLAGDKGKIGKSDSKKKISEVWKFFGNPKIPLTGDKGKIFDFE